MFRMSIEETLELQDNMMVCIGEPNFERIKAGAILTDGINNYVFKSFGHVNYRGNAKMVCISIKPVNTKELPQGEVLYAIE